MVDQAEIHRLVQSKDLKERKRAVEEVNNNFAIIKDKEQAWDDMIGLMQDEDFSVRWGAVRALVSCYSYIPEEYREQAWDDLHRLTLDNNDGVRSSAANALGAFYPYIEII